MVVITTTRMSKSQSKKRRSFLSPRFRQRSKIVILALLAFGIFMSTMKRVPNKSNDDEDAIRCSILKKTPQELSELAELDLKGCLDKELPSSIQYATNIVKLDLSANEKLTTLPVELAKCTKLDTLFISSCPGITTLPAVLGQMPSIRVLGWRSGSLTHLDPAGIPPHVQHLILTNNNIEKIDDPLAFEKLRYVRKLMLSHNQISSFGGKGEDIREDTIGKLEKLELVRLAGNQLTSIPSNIWNLPKLSWLTISGNPFTKILLPSNVPWITKDDLTSTGDFLGKGASGSVSSYTWNGDEVALKLIHGVTSDGRAEDELAIYGAVGPDGEKHRVVGCKALLQDDGNGKKGVLMNRLPDGLVDLALPPTTVEVTADRWDGRGPFSTDFILNLLTDLSKGLAYLHNRVGIAHGDVYGHNIKVDLDTGRMFLLDYGASYSTGKYAKEAEQLEVRAFGVLVHELLSIADTDVSDTIKQKLEQLMSNCKTSEVHRRLTFTHVVRFLEIISDEKKMDSH